MSARNNFVLPPILISKLTYFLVILVFFVITCLSSLTLSQECSTINDCKCIFPNKSIIDISSLGHHNHEPRWLDELPTYKNDSARYSYNPCYKFNLGSGETCHNVAVCRRLENKQSNCGDTARFVWNADRGYLQIIYTVQGSNDQTTVNLVCSPETRDPQLKVEGLVTAPNHYEMTLTSRCACSDLCLESHLSTGSVLVILFMIFTVLYLVLGIIHSSLTRGAHGWELIPHHEFWADFPLLVRDGCVFVVSGFKTDTAYEKI